MFDNLPTSPRAARILLLDDQPAQGRSVAGALDQLGFRSEHLPDPEAVLKRALAAPAPDLVLLQRRRDGRSGVPFLMRLRAASATPCVFRALGADDEWDRIAALEAGADDYVTACMGMRELAARLRRVLERAAIRDEEARVPVPGPTAPEELELAAGVTLSVRRRDVFLHNRSACDLTSAEFELLHVLVRAAGHPVSRDALAAAVLRRPHYPEDRALDNLVLRLRRKLASADPSDCLIKAVRGIGYAFTGLVVRREAEAAR